MGHCPAVQPGGAGWGGAGRGGAGRDGTGRGGRGGGPWQETGRGSARGGGGNRQLGERRAASTFAAGFSVVAATWRAPPQDWHPSRHSSPSRRLSSVGTRAQVADTTATFAAPGPGPQARRLGGPRAGVQSRAAESERPQPTLSGNLNRRGPTKQNNSAQPAQQRQSAAAPPPGATIAPSRSDGQWL